MGKLPSWLEALRSGSSLTDVATWKNRAAATTAVIAFLVAAVHVAKAYGYETSWISPDDITGLAVGIVAAVQLYFNYATSTTVGVLPARPQPPVAVSSSPGNQEAGASDMHTGP